MTLELRKAFLFDIDGTLIDSNSAHTLSWQRAFEHTLGKHYPYARIRRLIGMGDNQLIPMLSGIQDHSPDGQKISRMHSEILLKKYLSALKAMPQARELIHALRSLNIKTAVATTMKRGEMEKLLHQAGLLGSFDLAISSDDLEEAGASTNPILIAIEKLQLSPKDAYFVADTPYDVEHAGSCGVEALALRSGGWDDEGLARAYRIFDDPSDLLREIQNSVPALSAA